MIPYANPIFGYPSTTEPTSGSKLCEDLIGPQKHLLIGKYIFVCPYCRKEWPRGKSKEGFVKSGANNHVFHCFELRLFELGYYVGNWVDGKQLAQPFSNLKGNPREKTLLRTIKASLSKARKSGRLPA